MTKAFLYLFSCSRLFVASHVQKGVHPPWRNFAGTFGSGLVSLNCDCRYENAALASASLTLSLCDSWSDFQRSAVRWPIAEQARLWHDPQLFRTTSRPAPGGKI